MAKRGFEDMHEQSERDRTQPSDLDALTQEVIEAIMPDIEQMIRAYLDSVAGGHNPESAGGPPIS